MKISVSISVEEWARNALKDKNFVTIYEVARMLGISTKTAGRVLKKLEELGLVERWSRRAYRVKLRAASVVESRG